MYCGEMIEYSNLRAKLRKGLRAGGKMAHKRRPQGGQNLKQKQRRGAPEGLENMQAPWDR